MCPESCCSIEYFVGLFIISHFCVLDLILQEAEQTGRGDEEEQR